MGRAPAARPRNLVLCCDGTSNQFTKDHTNVIKLCYTLEKDPERQLVYYHPGVGTRAPTGVGSRVGKWWGKLMGLAFGAEIQRDVSDAYIFLMNHYRPGDRICIFGFSRGAYTARVIAAMLHLYGLAMPGNDALIPYAIDMMWAISKVKDATERRRYFELARKFRSTVSGVACKTHFVGVWDTVNSVGWIGSPLALPYTRDNPDIAIARHAIAIDESRGFFRANWFAEDSGSDVEQVWFPGTHCDVGGGHPELDAGMSKYALEWMAEEARLAGLLIDEARLRQVLGTTDNDYSKALPRATLHRTITGFWILAEFIPKKHWNRVHKRLEWRVNLFRRRTLPERPCVHDVAWEIPDDYAQRLPAGAIRLSEFRRLRRERHEART